MKNATPTTYRHRSLNEQVKRLNALRNLMQKFAHRKLISNRFGQWVTEYNAWAKSFKTVEWATYCETNNLPQDHDAHLFA